MPNRETRSYCFEVRAEQNDEHGHFLTGRPIVFNQRTNIGPFDEVIDPGALDGTDLRDVRFLVGHNDCMIPLARSRNNNANSTMQLMVVPAEGMDIRVDLDTENNSDSRSLWSATGRGDISGMSFAFFVDKDAWDDIESDHPTRHIRHIMRVLEVSAVAFPAYEGTSLSVRSEGATLDSGLASLESARAKLKEERQQAAQAEKLSAAVERLRKYRKETDTNE